MKLLPISTKNAVLNSVGDLLDLHREEIIAANKEDLDAWSLDDQAMYDRLVVNNKKVDGMIRAVNDIIQDSDPVGKELYKFTHPNGMTVFNKTAPFGNVLIIYESRPDVTIEAAMVAFKSNNKILLKGGKEALHSNRVLVKIWHKALEIHELKKDWITLLEFNRHETQEFLKAPDRQIDLIVPRGGDGLINFVKTHASCPVLISGRGNNFLFVDQEADWRKAVPIIINAKTDKISACNALDKVIIDRKLPELSERLSQLVFQLNECGVEVLVDSNLEMNFTSNELKKIQLDDEWNKEYLAMKIAVGIVEDRDEAIELINTHSGGHSASIVTENEEVAKYFMEEIDAAAVYHNASTRFTDGGEFGLGAELAISTDKLHHRGPLGLHQLVTNKWYIFGNGQIR